VSGLRTILAGVLDEEDLLLAEDRQQRVRREAMTAGRGLLPRVLADSESAAWQAPTSPADSLGLAEATLPRLLGFGWQQAGGLATIAGTPTRARAEVARLGGLLNLGVALFDHVCDRSPGQAELLLAGVTPESLDAQLLQGGRAAPPSGDAGVDLLLAIIANFFSGANRLEGSAREHRTFVRLIRSMYGGERFATGARREHDLPTRQVWWELRRKSVLPTETMASLALLAHPKADATQRSTVRLAAALAGEAIWIVDDLADVREDWDAGSWSRPLWLLARTRDDAIESDETINRDDSTDGSVADGREATLGANAISRRIATDGEQAIRRLLDTGIAAAEARRLAERLGALRELPGAPERAFLRPLQAVVHSWLELVAD
jgi:hypothetical protein